MPMNTCPNALLVHSSALMVPSSWQPEVERLTISTLGKLNVDIILESLHYLSPADLSSAALISHSILPTARSLLYRRICFSPTSRRVVKLEQTLRDSAHLRALIRHLLLKRSYFGPSYAASLDWISLLPVDSLQSVHFAFYATYHLLDPVLRYPAIRTARAVTASVSDFTTSSRVEELLSFPKLNALSLRFRWFAPAVQRTAPSLKHLTLSIESISENTLDFLTAVSSGCRLERLALEIDVALSAGDVAVLARGLAPLLSALRHLSIISPYRLAQQPFMDDLIPSMPCLETLHCGFGAYSPTLLSRLPQTLRVLVLGWGNSRAATDLITQWDLFFPVPHLFNIPFPSQTFAVEIARLAAVGCISVDHIIIVHPGQHSDDYQEMAQVCRRAAIRFQVMSAHYGLLNSFV